MDPTVYLPKKAVPLPKRAVIIVGDDGKRYARFKPRGKRTEVDFPLTRCGTKYLARKQKYWGMFSDPVTGAKKRVSLGVSDEKIARKLVKEKFLAAVRNGGNPHHENEKDVPLEKHVAEFEKHLRRPSQGNSDAHVRNVIGRLNILVEGCGFVFWSDMSAEPVQSYIDDLLTAGKAQHTVNRYLRGAKSFTRWMRQRKRASGDPLELIQQVAVTEKDKFRALTDEEVGKLIAVMRCGPTLTIRRTNDAGKAETIERPNCVEGIAGDEWAIVFILAVNSGLRRTELRTLTWGSVFIDGDSPSVVVRSGYSKHRKVQGGRDEPVLIHTDVARELRRWRDRLSNTGSDDPVFPGLKPHTKNSKAMRIYCEAAGVPFRTQDGRAAFHVTRHTFGTRMDEAGLPESIRMEQGRWTQRAMLDNYTSVRRPRIRRAVDAMPAVVGSAAEPEIRRATGTDDAAP